MTEVIRKLSEGNTYYRTIEDEAKRIETARNGQHPGAVVVCCSDSRVIPEKIFHVGIGELFVIRVAGNVLGAHALGSIEYAIAHLGCKEIIVLGHTGCGAVGAALAGESEGLIGGLTGEILRAIGTESDPVRACEKNVLYGAERIKTVFSDHPKMQDVNVRGAVYEIETGAVRWL